MSVVNISIMNTFQAPLLLCDLFIQIYKINFYNGWPSMVMIIQLTMRASNDKEKLHCDNNTFIFYVIIVARIFCSL